MIFVSIVLVLCLQWCFPRVILSLDEGFAWYYQQLTGRFDLSGLHPWLGSAILLLPPWILALVLLMLANFFFGSVIYWLLVIGLLYFCIDFRQSSQGSAGSLVAKMFSPVFWFAVLGIPLLLFMLILRHGRTQCLSNERYESVADGCTKLLKLLAWLPSRLVVLGGAVVGDFSATLREAKEYWFESPFAVARDVLPGQPLVTKVPASGVRSPLAAYLCSHFFRVLLVWLVVMAVFALGHWIAG